MKLRFTIPQLFIAILFVGLFVMATRPVLDADFWWHLRTGQWIIENRAVPRTDPFSFTFEGKPWTAHEWLSETIIYGIYKVGGLALLSLVFSGVITIAFLTAYKRSPGQPYIAGFVMVLGAIASAPIWGVRPQMFTLLFFSLYLYLLDQYFKSGNLKFIIPLPLLMVVWVNLHAGYALGLVLMGIYIGGKTIEAYMQTGWLLNEPSPRRFLLPAVGIFIASTIAVTLNPNGIYMFIYPFETLGSNAMMNFIVEWFSPDFHALEWLPLAALMMILLSCGLFSGKRSSVTEIILSAVMFYAALRSMRNAPLFAVAVIPLISQHLDLIFPPIQTGRTNPSKIINSANIIVLIFVALLGITQIFSVLMDQKEAEKDYFPVKAVEWIKENHPEGNIYNSYGWGGYLIWHLYPDYRVYIDGRADLYGDVFMQDFRNIYNIQAGWEEKLDKAKINLVLVETGSPIANTLVLNTSWVLAYEDDLSQFFTRK